MGIVAIVATMALPQFDSMLEAARVKSVAGRIQSKLQEARLKALGEGVPFRIEFDASANRVTFIKLLGGGEETEETLNVSEVASGVALESVSIPGQKVYLDTRGRFYQVASGGLQGSFLQQGQNTVVVSSASTEPYRKTVTITFVGVQVQ